MAAALLERPVVRQNPSTVSPLVVPDEPMAGVQIVQSASAALPGQIEAGDLLRVDFDQHRFTRDGLYVLQTRSGWIGVRRITSTAQGPCIEEAARLTPLSGCAQVISRVLQVYAPRRIESGRVQ